MTGGEDDFLAELQARIDRDLGIPAAPDLDSLSTAEPVELAPDFVERTLQTVRQTRRHRLRRSIKIAVRLAALLTVTIAAIVAGTRYVRPPWDHQTQEPTTSLDFESALSVIAEEDADDNRQDLALFKLFAVSIEALDNLRATRDDPELGAAIDAVQATVRETIDVSREEPLPARVSVIDLPPVVPLSVAHARVADRTRPTAERLQALTIVEDALLLGIRAFAFVERSHAPDTKVGRDAAMFLDRLPQWTR